VFSGHFHKRQHQRNITYMGNSFPHNYADVNDDDRGMMIIDWGKKPKFYSWPDAPKYRIYNLSDALENADTLLVSNSHCKLNLDIEISFEEACFMREQLIPKHNLRELTLIPVKRNVEEGILDADVEFESVDTIIADQIGQLEDGGAFDKNLLLEIYTNL
jgi:hypothetical protein